MLEKRYFFSFLTAGGDATMWKNLAHGILTLHSLCSLFVILIPLLVPLGVWQSWSWVRDPWLRSMHLAVVLFIAGEVILGQPCPFMVWENHCRRRAGMPLYTTGFFDFWIERLLKIPFKTWMFESIFFTVGASTLVEFFVIGPMSP